mgnify:FL=1
MAVVQISRIQHRRGLATDLPQLAAGELGWSIDDQRLYIGNGTVADGAPAVGNTEILTTGSTSFTTALSYYYKGYLGDSTPIVTGASGNFTRTAQKKLDDFVTVKDFGALGDGSTNDTSAIQRALDELYTDSDKDDERARRVLYFPAGDYRINASLKIPPFAHLRGAGIGKSVLLMSGSATALVTKDDEGNTFGTIGNSAATTPTNIQLEGLDIRNGSSYGGFSIDNATKVYVSHCRFQGAYAAGGADNALGKGITVRSTNTLKCANIYFDHCQFGNFARLIDMSMDVTNVRFFNCDFDTAYNGVIIGSEWDGSTTNGMSVGPRDLQVISSSFSNIGQQAIYVKPKQTVEAPSRNILSHSNFFASTVANNFEGVGTLNEVPTIQYDQDECSSTLDFFERHDLRRTDGSSHMNIAPEVQGIARTSYKIKQVTLADATSTATTTGLEYSAGSGNLGKSIVLNYKIERGPRTRVGSFTISVNTNGISFNDDYTESGTSPVDVGVTLTATLGRDDSTNTDRSVIVKYQTTTTSTAATMDAEPTLIV